MSSPKIIQPFAPPTPNRPEEINRNADRWAQIAARELPDDIGFVFFFMPKAGGLPAIRTDMRPEALRRMLELVLRRFADQNIGQVS